MKSCLIQFIYQLHILNLLHECWFYLNNNLYKRLIAIVASYNNTSSFQAPSNLLVKGIIKVIEFPPVIPCNLFSWNPNNFCIILFAWEFFLTFFNYNNFNFTSILLGKFF